MSETSKKVEIKVKRKRKGYRKSRHSIKHLKEYNRVTQLIDDWNGIDMRSIQNWNRRNMAD